MTTTTSRNTTYRVHLFARYAELLGHSAIEIQLSEGATGLDLVGGLRVLPGGDLLPAAPFLAVNLCHVPLSTRLNPSDEIALLPPMAGG
jgi:molybdopterin converting factor small subunit